MKKPTSLIVGLLAMCTAAWAEDKVSGWNIGPLPCVSYNSDLGFQYGVCADAFYYGDGSLFPEYEHRFYVEASRYTKGQTLLHAQYDSKHLIPGVRVTSAISYQYDPLYYFYGFNGAVKYEKQYDLNHDTQVARYNYQRGMLRVLLDFQGRIAENLNWVAGASFWSMSNKEFSSDKYQSSTSLYSQYVRQGLISSVQAGGGKHIEAKVGAVYDTRDLEAAPSRGIWAEAYVNGSPRLFGVESGYLKIVAHFRQYISLGSDRFVLAYHLGYQDTVAGQTPFYMLPVIYTLYLRQTGSEGLGGLNTVRGLIQNRLTGEGYLWGNFEFRARLFDFKFLGQSWYLATNPFLDAGYVVRAYRPDVFGEGDKYAVSAGAGLKLAMNQNFIISVEAAQVIAHSEYPMGLTIALNYIF